MKEKDKKTMKALFREAGFSPDRSQVDLFEKFYDMLVKYNDEFDLTRLRNFDDIIIKHFVDSIYIGKLAELPSPLLDIGTGAGFPGIPLKIMNPDLHLVLAEPRHKRVRFLHMVIEELGLENTEVYPHLVTDKSFFNVNGVITRALESAAETLERVSHFLPEGGSVIFMKGPGASRDLENMQEQSMDGYSLLKQAPYTLPGTEYDRALLVFKREKSAISRAYHIMKNPEETTGLAITSPDNRRFRELKKLLSADGIRKSGTALVSGKKIVTEILENAAIKVEQIILFDGYREESESLNSYIQDAAGSSRVLILKKSLYNELDPFRTQAPLVVARVPEQPEWDREPGPGCTVLVPFQDPANVGSVIRTAAAFGIKRVVLLREAAHPFHPKAVRSSAGAVFQVRIERGPSITGLSDLASRFTDSFLVLDSGGEDIRSFDFPESFMLLPGIEGPGIPDNLHALRVAVPLHGPVESLNAATAVSIALYEITGRAE